MSHRITVEAGKRGGQTCVRGLRITVWDVLTWLAGGMSEDEILAEYPELEREDFRAVYEYAAGVGLCEAAVGRVSVMGIGGARVGLVRRNDEDGQTGGDAA